MKKSKKLLALAGDENAQTGFLFYPGGKVESYAYLPLMEKIAQAALALMGAR